LIQLINALAPATARNASKQWTTWSPVWLNGNSVGHAVITKLLDVQPGYCWDGWP